ncbi:hypothetical protein SAMN05443575_3059 [Jatrophihabitans endophyticus]|uniref:PH domain-containing protein n=1 Tax=Jatrophihabitans endophyticus TaxID=1206085 RepID=A0A1M5PFX0_9ACTN|nr:hypothetical protein [Jatrophihabitans endophyticus]SHH00143.1 hypothetical protein SAMN05443575_3059 [Jatrophihabitans endophyticus]
MADGKTTLTKPMTPLLAPGEELLGGCKAAGKNAPMKAMASSATGVEMGEGPGAGGWAGVVPQDRVFWVGATNRRLVYFGVGYWNSTPKSLRGETPLEAVASIVVSRTTIARRLAMTFTDGTSTVVDLYRANSPDQLQEALTTLLPGRVVEG